MNIEIRLAKTRKDIDDALKVRKLVFVKEQKIPENIVVDKLENQADHFLALNHLKPVGTARIRYLDDEIAKIERMAILKEYRGKEVGSKLLKYILNVLNEKGIKTATMNAQLSTQQFYSKFGFRQVGKIFEEVGIKHIKMVKKHLKMENEI